MYIHEQPDWPHFTWNTEKILTLLTTVRNMQGQVVGRMGALGFELRNQANLEIITQDVLKSTEIEGELLNADQVRSSVARRLGLDISGLVHSDRNVDGVVEMMVDATENFNIPLDKGRLFGWHNALFPSGYSGMYKVLVGRWRDDSSGSMQVVSGPVGKEKVHFEAPAADLLETEMKRFLNWINERQPIDPVLKSAIGHLWFVTLHPFEDGNGRIARAISDMLLARSDNQSYRFYSMSAQIRKEREQYYDILERTQRGKIDITDWLEWFLQCLLHAIEASETVLEKILRKHSFWMRNAAKIKNERQKKLLNRLLDGFKGKLTTSKWAKIAKCSQDTATRDIQDLIDKEILYKLPGGGRSTGYDLIDNIEQL
ncbi:MAG: Fic family protein [Candidatus Electrothrix communis]|nr:MAG: Fic family protein [Candidatus Electrothrix communis]